MPVIRPLVGSGEAPQQHKQPSRKGKKAWRKHVDVTDVERGLDELNEAIIQGGVVSEKPSEDLFVVDTGRDATLRNKIPQHLKKLRSDEIIAQRSAVPAVAGRKRPADNLKRQLVSDKRPRTKYVSHKELMRLWSVADGHHEQTVEIRDASYDPWDTTVSVKPTDEKYSFLPPKVDIKAPETLHHKPISLAANGKDIPAVKKPAGAFSYNPLYTDYEERLEEEGVKAVEAERQRLAEEEADRIKQQAAERSGKEADLADARAELSEWEEDSGWEGFESGTEEPRSKAKRPERKTKVQRNKAKRRKEAEALAKHEAAMRKQRADVDRAKSLAKEADARKQAVVLAKQEFGDSDDESEGDDEQLRRRRFGNSKLPEKDLELVLPDELQESLRLLKPEGNLLKDRYRNLLVRGKMESRRRFQRKKAKVVYKEKWSYKDFSI